MVWLATHIWMLLAAAGVIGLLLGLGLRGLLLGGKARRALVERDVALTELDQARAEIEGLYASQRQVREAPAADDSQLRDELAAREAKVASLTEELFRSREEIDALKSGRGDVATGAGLAAAGAVAGAAAASLAGDGQGAAGDGAPAEDEDSLEWRNRYLESRVRRLEQDLEAASRATAETAAAPAASAAAAAPEAVAGDGPDPTDVAKLRWQNDYLQTRVKVLEEKLASANAVAGAPIVDEPIPAGQTDAPAAEEQGRTETADEELARLRWRNRYLEGRLAYLEEGGAAGPGGAGEEARPTLAAGAAGLAAGAFAAGLAQESETATAAELEPLTESPPAGAEAAPEPVAEPEVAPEAGAEAAPEPVAEPETAPEAEAEPEAPAESEPEPVAEPLAEAEAAPEPETRVSPAAALAAPALFELAPSDEAAAAAHAEASQARPVDPADPPSLFGDGKGGYVPAFAGEPAMPEADPEPVDPAPEEAEPQQVAAPAAEVEAEPEPAPAPEPEMAADEVPEEAPIAVDAEPVDDAAPAEAADDAAAPVIAPERPPQISKPRDGGDDLAEIGGIGPRIQDVLQELGIYRYSQIAAWTPANEAWIDDYLSFSGRVGRERWVEQARALAEQDGKAED